MLNELYVVLFVEFVKVKSEKESIDTTIGDLLVITTITVPKVIAPATIVKPINKISAMIGETPFKFFLIFLLRNFDLKILPCNLTIS